MREIFAVRMKAQKRRRLLSFLEGDISKIIFVIDFSYISLIFVALGS
jgi:hypothetical protein